MKKQQMLVTTNYNMFRLMDKNRKITKNRVLKMMASIKKNDMTDCNPIIVNEKMQIIDGQTRFTACKNLGKPIYYIKKDMKGKSDAAMITLNVSQANWTRAEYIDHYAKHGKQAYLDIVACMKKYHVTASTAVTFVTNSPNGGDDDLKKGTLKRGETPYNVYGDILMDFKKIFKNYNHVFFIRALVYIIKKGHYKHENEFKKFTRNRAKLMGCATMIQYLHMFEDIMNSFRRGKKLRIVSEYTDK